MVRLVFEINCILCGTMMYSFMKFIGEKAKLTQGADQFFVYFLKALAHILVLKSLAVVSFQPIIA